MSEQLDNEKREEMLRAVRKRVASGLPIAIDLLVLDLNARLDRLEETQHYQDTRDRERNE